MVQATTGAGGLVIDQIRQLGQAHRRRDERTRHLPQLPEIVLGRGSRHSILGEQSVETRDAEVHGRSREFAFRAEALTDRLVAQSQRGVELAYGHRVVVRSGEGLESRPEYLVVADQSAATLRTVSAIIPSRSYDEPSSFDHCNQELHRDFLDVSFNFIKIASLRAVSSSTDR